MTAPAAIAVVQEFSVTVTGERAGVWQRVLGTDEVPVLSPSTSMVDIPDHGRCQAYLLDVMALSGEQHARLAFYLSDKFNQPLQAVIEEMNSRGLPVVAEGCVAHPRTARWTQ